MSFLSETIGRVLGRGGRGEAPSALRFNSWEAGGRGAGVFEKSAEALELERMNPLRGVDEWRLGQIFDDARDGIYADLAWLYNEIEGVEPALMACCETRESAAGELAWTVRTADADRARGFDQSLADEQRAALLAEFGAVADDIPDLAGHMTTAFFRGAAHALPLWDADGSLAGFRPLDLWNFAFDRGSGIWYWNADASRDEGSFAPIPPGELVSLAVSSSRHVDHAALPIFIRAALGAKRYGVWLDRFGIPPVGVIMPPNAERGEQGAYMDLARKFARGGSGILPNGSQVTYGTEARAVCPFPEFIRFQQQQIYAVGMGRVQSGENQGDNLGGNAAGVVDSALRRIVRRDARRIARAVNDCVTRKVLERLFPGRPALARFDFDTEARRSAREALEDAGLARNAGLAIDRGQLEEMTGYSLSDAPQPANPGGFGGFGGALNSQDPDSGLAKPLQNARKGGDGEMPPQDPPARLDAILDDFSARLAEEMAEEMFAASAAGLKDGGRSAEDEGGDPALNSECHADDPKHCRVHGTPKGEEEHSPEEKKRIEEFKASTNQGVVDKVNEIVGIAESGSQLETVSKIHASFGPVSDQSAERMGKLLGHDVTGFEKRYDGSDILHTWKRHGKGGKADESMADVANFGRAGYVVDHADTMELLKKPNGDPDLGNFLDRSGKPSPKLMARMRIDGTAATTIIAPDSKRKIIHIVSMRIEKSKPEDVKHQ